MTATRTFETPQHAVAAAALLEGLPHAAWLVSLATRPGRVRVVAPDGL